MSKAMTTSIVLLAAQVILCVSLGVVLEHYITSDSAVVDFAASFLLTSVMGVGLAASVAVVKARKDWAAFVGKLRGRVGKVVGMWTATAALSASTHISVAIYGPEDVATLVYGGACAIAMLYALYYTLFLNADTRKTLGDIDRWSDGVLLRGTRWLTGKLESKSYAQYE